MLLSIDKLCTANITATFTENKLYIHRDLKFVLEGNRNKMNEMWYMNIQNKHPKNNAPLNNIGHNIYEIRKIVKNQILLPINVELCTCDLDQKYKIGFFRHMFRTNIGVIVQTPSTLHHNYQGTSNSNKKERLIHTPSYTKKRDS